MLEKPGIFPEPRWTPSLLISVNHCYAPQETVKHTNEQLKVVLVLGVGTPSCADVTLLGLQSLKHRLKTFFPLLLSTLDREDESLSDRHVEKLFGLYRTILKLL